MSWSHGRSFRFHAHPISAPCMRIGFTPSGRTASPNVLSSSSRISAARAGSTSPAKYLAS